MTEEQQIPNPTLNPANNDNNKPDNKISPEQFINRVSIRPPPFSKERPALWFSSLEAQFHINSITSEITKFHFAVAHLDIECTKEVEDIITQPPKEEPYSKLKHAIISRFSDSYEEKIRRLLENEPLGDRKPTSFLRHLKSLAGTTFPEQALKTIWINRFPPNVQFVLASRKEKCLEDLSELADQLMEIASHSAPQMNTCAVQPSTSRDIEALHQKVDQLTHIVASLTAGDRSGPRRPRSRSSSRHRMRSRSRSRNPQWCFYHNRFAHNARNCIEPCTWKDNQGNKSSDR